MTTRRSLPATPGPRPRFAGMVSSAGWFVVLLAGVAVATALIAETVTGAAALPGLPAPSVAVKYGVPVVRVLLDVSVVTTMGLALLAKFLGFDDPDRTEPVMRTARRAALWSSWTWVGSALVSLVLLSVEVYPTEFPTRTSPALDLLTAPLSFLQYLVGSPDLVLNYVVGVPAGKGLLTVAGIGLLSVWLCRVAVRRGESVPAELRAGVAAFGLLPIPLTGHATDWIYHDLMMMSMELHLIGAAAWVGGLGATIVFLARRPHLLAVALPRFSKLATYCVFIVAASGVFSGLSMLATADITVPLPDSLWTTHYGQLMIVKLVCVAVIAALAVGVRRGMLVRISDRRPTAVAVWCGFELVVMAIAYGVAVVLTRSAPY
ncbi:copper resistance D family protein [Nakamurella deserti]|uniref:copper resistance D family protein n=1 Tax=Nakamurella deserti TaxID=2164074 RepID=UPI000DBE6A40|nr:CopD family protein [Nakamurella deserti]